MAITHSFSEHIQFQSPLQNTNYCSAAWPPHNTAFLLYELKNSRKSQ